MSRAVVSNNHVLIFRRWIVHVKKDIQQLFVSDRLRIERDLQRFLLLVDREYISVLVYLNDFSMICFTRAYVFIRRSFPLATSISRDHLFDA